MGCRHLVGQGIPRGYENLQRKLIQKGLTAYSKGNIYVYQVASNSWSTLASEEVQIQINSITGAENASVSYAGAATPFARFIRKCSRRTTAIPVSICIGTRRLKVAQTEGGLILVESEPIAHVAEGLDARIASFCVMPCDFDMYPTMWKNVPGKLFRYLQVLFNNPVDLMTIMWLVGNGLIDPGMLSKFLLLHGTGGTGKSTVIRAIERACIGCCATIGGASLTSRRIELHPDVAKLVVSHRFVTAGEIGASSLNTQALKEMTGHDTLAIKPLSTVARCTVVAASNQLPDPSVTTEWTSTAMTRRSVIVPMNVLTKTLPHVKEPDTAEDNIDFIMHCVYIRTIHPSMPISIKGILQTILGNEYYLLVDSLEEIDNPSMQESIDVTFYLDYMMGLSVGTLGTLTSMISNTAVVRYGDNDFIAGIKLVEDVDI